IRRIETAPSPRRRRARRRHARIRGRRVPRDDPAPREPLGRERGADAERPPDCRRLCPRLLPRLRRGGRGAPPAGRVVRRRDRPERRGHVRRRVERDPAVPRELAAAPPARSGRPSHRRLAPLLRVRPVPVPGGARRLAGGSRPGDRTAGTVSAHAALGLVALNALFLVAGCGVLFAIRGWRSWSELLRLAGLAYLLGVAAVTLIETWALVAGASAHVAVVLAISLGTAAAGFGAGAVLG